MAPRRDARTAQRIIPRPAIAPTVGRDSASVNLDAETGAPDRRPANPTGCARHPPHDRLTPAGNTERIPSPAMEVMLRCEVPDRPGALAELAGAVSNAGGDIESVEVLGDGREGHVLDDLVVVGDADVLRDVVRALENHPHVRLVHAGPSRGHPGDAVTRLAVGLEALLTGTAAPDHGLNTLVGGLLQASEARLVAAGDAPELTRRRMVLPVDHRVLVVERDYPFTESEHERARSLVRLGTLALHMGNTASAR